MLSVSQQSTAGSPSVTQVRTKRGTDEWVFKPNNLMPGFGKGFAFVNKFEPRFSIPGPLKRDRLLLGQCTVPLRPHGGQEPARRAPAWPRQLRLVHSARRHIVVAARAHPGSSTSRAKSKRDHVDVSPTGDDAEVLAGGFAAGLVDRLILSSHAVLESTFASRAFEVDLKTQGELPMVYAPQGRAATSSTVRRAA